jgi:CBS domain-containing protein
MTSTETRSTKMLLDAATAEELMTPDPLALDADASVREAMAFLTDRGFSAAPVVNAGGKFVGVLSRTDILEYERGRAEYLPGQHPDDVAERVESKRDGYQIENVDRTTVRDVMTPVMFSVAPDTPTEIVVAQMLNRKIHRLFVATGDGVPVGVITTFDILKRLRPEA